MQIDDIISRLKETGYKLTPQRLAICKMVLESKAHPSAEMIFTLLKKDYPSMSLATIYKTFHLLQKMELIQDAIIDEGKIRIDPNKNLHINLICTKCGVIKDISTDNLTQQWAIIVKELEINPTGQLINVYYECELCKKQKKIN